MTQIGKKSDPLKKVILQGIADKSQFSLVYPQRDAPQLVQIRHPS